MNRSPLVVALAAAALLGPLCGVALAQSNSEPDLRPTRYEGSAQNFAFELRFSAYRPNVDDEFGGSGPFHEIFGDSPRLLIGAEFDWQLLRLKKVGSLGLGANLGYTKCSGRAPLADGTGRSAEDTGLQIIPMASLAVARLDLLNEELGVPLIPFVKLGPATALWSVSNGTGTAKVGSTSGRGRSDGLFYAAGLALQLDFLEPSARSSLDETTGVNHSYLFGEWTVYDLGTSSQMQVGSNSWTLGLAFEF